MENQGEKRPEKQRVSAKTTGVLFGCSAVIVLLIALCISVVMRSNIQGEYTQARSEIGEELYTQLYMLCQTFDQVDVPGQDVENVVVPLMKDYFLAARTLSEVMGNAFGQRYAVLTQENIAQIDAAFEAYAAAFRGGKSTEEAQAAMQACMDMVRGLLQTRFNDGVILAAK